MLHELTDYVLFEKESKENLRLLRQEDLILHVTNTLSAILEKEGISKTDLAKKLGKTKGFVSQVLAGNRNLTLRTIADIATAIGVEIRLDVKLTRPRENNVLHLQMCAPGRLLGTPWLFPSPPIIKADGRRLKALSIEALEHQGAAA